MPFAKFIPVSARLLAAACLLLVQSFHPLHAQQALNACDYLGHRSDKNFLGSGNMALVTDSYHVRVLFVQQWNERGLMDWAAGKVGTWYPDRMEMKDALPATGALVSRQPVSRQVFITRDDVAGMELRWKNNSKQTITIQAAFTGHLPGKVQQAAPEQAGLLVATADYSAKLKQPLYYIVGSTRKPSIEKLENNSYSISYSITIPPGRESSLTILLGIGTGKQLVESAVAKWEKTSSITEAVRADWNNWFENAFPQFSCSDPYFQKMYYYRWWSLYTKMIFAKLGHFIHPAPREGTVAYEGVVSYSGACVSVDELRWMRDPSWALSTTEEFFAPENMNDGYLSNHIWDWGIDADESNMDALGRSVPYQNYAIDAFRGILQVHPEPGNTTLKKVWPQFLSNLQSYDRLFDIDKDGLYETYPWSNSAGQEWSARFSYFDPLPEQFRNERSRTYAPDGSRAAEDMALLNKIRNTVVTDPDLHWPQTAEELYRTYYATADHRLATVDQSTYAWRNFDAAAELARLIKDTAAERKYDAMRDRTAQAIRQNMWHPEDRFYYDVQPVTQKPARVKNATGYYVFWAGLADRSRVSMLDDLFDTACFGTRYPVPSLPLNYKKYKEIQAAGWNYWNYAAWPRTTCHVVDGALLAAKTLDSNYRRKAADLFTRYTRMHFAIGGLQQPVIGERFDPHTGQAFMEELDYNHSSWIDILLKHVAGITPDASGLLVIDPVDMEWESFSFTGIRYHQHSIDISYNRRDGLTIRVDGIQKITRPGLERVELRLPGGMK